ncbi:acyl carrier protein phosphodiesterase [Urechidicola croceus]|uniref:ACP phosphodiesterase n=1 Tax=Urechidicola croceus TaxID=1850246 RepID=A0A1D8P695_9FLAO|nr:acyl carrier protein phosphodiesterase [Urechidicola croceus]AOW20062.1 ACP phosphodiesterase [Urechidicola croceus]
MIGNFIADAVRGNKYKNFSQGIQNGIILHRHIDTFTDKHEIVRKSKRRLHERYGHYDGVIIDLFYDHFLAKNWNDYSVIPLDIYAQGFYNLLRDNYNILPEKTQQLLPALEKYNWLYNYQFIEGMKSVLQGMNKRTKMISKMDLAIEDLQLYYSDFEKDFTIFFNDLIAFTNKELIQL